MLFGKKSLREVEFEDVLKVVKELKEPESVLLDYKSRKNTSGADETGVERQGDQVFMSMTYIY